MEIKLDTLTPIWTGGVEGNADRLHATGLIGSLRWWYEVIVRGLGGWACDPSSDEPEQRCGFDTKTYQQAKREGKSDAEVLAAGLKTVCPVCYLFGATGWTRQFQLQVQLPFSQSKYLHFRTTTSINKNWLNRVFGGTTQSIDHLKVTYGGLVLSLHFRTHETSYMQSQLALILKFVAEYGSLGAKPQHGFGIITIDSLPTELEAISVKAGLEKLRDKLQQNRLLQNGPTLNTPYNLVNFVSLKYSLSQNQLAPFISSNAHLGNGSQRNEVNYLPCAFDLRYKGAGNWGMRNWLEETKLWEHEDLNKLMGLSIKKGQSEPTDDERIASRLCFGMPYKVSGATNNYTLRLFGFSVPEMQTSEDLRELYGVQRG